LRRENLRLAEENARLNNKIDQLQQQLLAITDTMPRKLVIDNDRYFIYTSGNIINSSTNRSRNFLTADVGSKSGITDNMIVVNEDGVIGMVTATSKHFCTILPIINNASRLSAKIKKSGFHGQIVWNEVSYRRAIMEDVPEHAVVAVGDSIVTSGSSSYYPENLYIGKISEIEMDRNGGFYRLIIELAVDYNSVSQVKFIRNKRADEQRALEEGQQ
jgi:rod shape-determining protein MreC